MNSHCLFRISELTSSIGISVRSLRSFEWPNLKSTFEIEQNKVNTLNFDLADKSFSSKQRYAVEPKQRWRTYRAVTSHTHKNTRMIYQETKWIFITSGHFKGWRLSHLIPRLLGTATTNGPTAIMLKCYNCMLCVVISNIYFNSSHQSTNNPQNEVKYLTVFVFQKTNLIGFSFDH